MLGRKGSGKLDAGDLRSSLSMTPASETDETQPRNRISFPFSASASRKNTDSNSRSSTSSVGSGSHGSRSPVTFDYLRSDEVRAAAVIANSSIPKDDALSFDTLAARQKAAPHLFVGAFVSLPPPIAAGPLSVTGTEVRRRLIGFCTATAAPAMIAQSFYGHSSSELACIVCLHLLCIEKQYRHRGLGLELLCAFIDRIQAVESGQGPDKPRGYEVIALICREAYVGFFMKAGFKFHGVSYISRGTTSEWIELRRPVKGSTPKISSALKLEDLWVPEPASYGSSVQSQFSDESPQETRQSRSFGDPEHGMTVSPISMNSPATHDSTLANILAQSSLSEGAARDLGVSTNRAPPSQRNTAIPLSAVYGRAVAAKTAWEDSLDALVAHLVDNASGTNMMRLYCPYEKCDCVLIARNKALWATKEWGPLIGTTLTTPGSNELDGENDVDDQLKFAWPENLYFKRDRSVRVAHDPIGPVRGMWVLSSPMQFDNISFAHNVSWKVPYPTARTPSNSEPPKLEKKRQMSISLRSNPEQQRTQPEQQDEVNAGEVPSYKLGANPDEVHTIKYILCPDCGTGPLGFMLVSSAEEAAVNGYAEQTCFVAASRVCYDM